MHPKLTQGNKTDLEAEFSSGCGGLWRSRGLAFRGKFSSTVQDGQLTLQDEATTLKGRMREASLSIQGSVIHEGSPGGEFILRPLPECYREWWSQVKGKLEDPNPGFLVLNEDGSFEGGDASDEDASSFPDITSPAELRKFLLLRRITQQVGSQRRPSPRRSKRQELLFKFALRPDEVKEYLDRYVICQTAAKEMLAVAICDHYNRAKEELLSSSPESESSESAVAVDSKADESKDPSEAVPEPAAEDSESRKSSETLDQVVFKDTDDDVILLQLDGDRVREFVNGELELEQVELFEIDVAQREYKDDSGRGKFQDEEDVTKIQQQVAGLFARAAKAALLKPARVKNYTKPNILLLGPTGSGKTYLLRNLADLIGVPFVKADATKFTETGYVGRDADEVMGELLQAADGDVELAQVGIVYVDEIDKVCSEGDGRTSSFRRATQSTFLKLMEDTEVTVGSGGPRSILGGLGGDKGVKLSTRHVLFVFSGAFSQLDEKLKEEHMRNAKGFGFTRDASEKSEEVKSMLHKADTEELVKAGMEREFVGRLPVRVALQALSEDDLFQVLTKAEEGATPAAWSACVTP
ncbi:unnamed protein product [Effrenium voratum]|uniref:AAA+ ATPase domain-containing protein n=1 Tax=Effrenium voratum TaxID=2562239 RepID=A0AA36NK57_9DINO|nr:unnamed protein product [Effrenium voratum]CAJ1455853.1 unnamed protein product [Effrenium voratum]